MHWKGLRLVADSSSKRQSTIDPHAHLQPQARRSEHLPRPSPPATEPRYSESTPRSPGLVPSSENPELAGPSNAARGLQLPGEQGPALDHRVARTDFAGSAGDTPSLRRNRFSFMRLRHASDPQLSKSYAKAEEAPPVPSLPPPKIITTAPTSNELDQPVKQRNKFSLRPSSRKHSMENLSRSSAEQSRTRLDRKNQGSTDSQIGDSSLSTFQSATEVPERLSINSRYGSRELESHRVSTAVEPRYSESSRSDQSYGDQAATYRTYPLRDNQRQGLHATTSNTNTKRFRLPRLKRNRSPLFPLPPKPVPNRALDAAPKFPAADTPKSDGSDDHDQVSPLPSPSRSSVGLASSVPPQLFRHDSTNSARSVRSTPSHQGRGRSSTMGSVAENQDDLSPVPNLASSGRTSTSTSGRKSFGDLFNISQRLRQNSEPPFPRNGSPGLGGSATPVSKPDLHPVPPREENDTPASYLTKLEENLPKGMIAGVLAQSDQDFYRVGLRKYMRGFHYFGDPIDMSIRKLLMEVELPKETQQIDRFLQAFADRYHECNPDQAYFIAFSILILHTDVFNKNNKRKMQKPDYVKNTRGEGISDDILECFYENISYTPFIHVEDADLRDRTLAKPRRALFKTASSEHLSRMSREPVDPYALILENKLGSLRPSLKDVMDLDDTYNHVGTNGCADINDLHQAFTKSGILQIVSARSRPDAFMQGGLANSADSNPGLVDIKVAKVGLLWRKDPKKKRARSPWAEWGAVLTFSQLYFFRNVNWVRNLMAQNDAYVKGGRKGTLVFRPPLTEFKPDGIMSTNDAVALLDSSYKKHKYAFSFVRHNSLEEIFLAQSEPEMNDWIAKLNYAAAFRTTGVRTKGMIATNYEGQRYRKSQRMNSISSEQSHQSHSTDKEPPSPSIDNDIVAEIVAARRELMNHKIRETNEKLFVTQRQLDDLLRNARHLQILTPVHARAREGVIMAAGRMSAKLKWVRQDIWRNKCYREVLLRDLGEDESIVPERAASVSDQPSVSLPARMPSVSGPSVISEPSVQQAPSIVHTASSHDTEELATAAVDRLLDAALLKQPSTEDMRRPSIPGSTTSSDIARVGRPLSIAMASDHGKNSDSDVQLQREASVLSRGSRFDGASLGSRGSKLTSPASYDDGEERLLRETGLLDLSGSPPPRKPTTVPETESESKPEDPSEVAQGDKPSRVRRSLHRSLREPHLHVHRHHSHTRGKKNRGSVGSIGPLSDEETGQEGGGLSRKTPSFTVHGKKASIVTFGSEWQNMSPEERLKLRKPTPHDEPRASEPNMVASGESVTSDSAPGGRPLSFRSVSTTTGISMRSDDEPVDFFKDAHENLPRPSTEVDVDLAPDQVDPDNTPRPSSGAPVYSSHLAAPTDTPSPSSTSLGEPPSSENLRQQAVGA
ncbi:hypothetical protein N7532_003630 [Penicillium argentinense]|uniref:Guanyl-nucleotide exchange factor n=1 Tax=Penicillium argentinense TaxID=1131581 RepID=A0A9W9FMS0_9EURO|nr:uncharacterized protein N7532_003630 [Penicillium argentinense]KAJ5103101.1 hypothetical protein N7532_003630 [Penicillium argentinense]